MSDKFQAQLKIAEQHYDSMPADLRTIYEAEYSAASAAYRTIPEESSVERHGSAASRELRISEHLRNDE